MDMKTEFKGTKGKWVYDHEQKGILDENGFMLADLFSSDAHPNGVLIAHAPEMLEFIKSIFEDYENGLIEDIEHIAIRAELLYTKATTF